MMTGAEKAIAKWQAVERPKREAARRKLINEQLPIIKRKLEEGTSKLNGIIRAPNCRHNKVMKS